MKSIKEIPFDKIYMGMPLVIFGQCKDLPNIKLREIWHVRVRDKKLQLRNPPTYLNPYWYPEGTEALLFEFEENKHLSWWPKNQKEHKIFLDPARMINETSNY